MTNFTVGWISHNVVIVLVLVDHLVIERADISRPFCNRVVSISCVWLRTCNGVVTSCSMVHIR